MMRLLKFITRTIVLKKIKMRAENVFERITNGILYNRNLKVYTKDYLEGIVRELEQQEQFEKCIKLNEFISKRFNHELNYKNPII
jgi:hypothetical protein